MNMLTFSAFALTRAEMKNVIGGSCYVVNSNKGNYYWSPPMSQSKAQKAQKQNTADPNAPGSYQWCCDSGCNGIPH